MQVCMSLELLVENYRGFFQFSFVKLHYKPFSHIRTDLRGVVQGKGLEARDYSRKQPS